MIKINLLGKKKAQAPFGLDPALEKLGISTDDLLQLRPAALKIVACLALLYACDYIPSYIVEQKTAELDAQIKVVNDKSSKLQAELNTKKELRKQMEQLQKDEADINKQLSAINGLTKDRGLAFRAVDNVTTILPAKVWFTKIDYAAHKMIISGSSWEYFAINDFVKSLNEISAFHGVNLSGISSEGTPKAIVPGVSEADQKIKSFDVDFTLKSSS
jgi:Tfp pilus assembly protein PilN